MEDILSGFPADLNISLVVAQHMPKYFTEVFSKRLDKLAPLRVREAQDGLLIRAGSALIVPGGSHMEITTDFKGSVPRGIIRLAKKPVKGGPYPSIDILMVSAAQNYPIHVVGVILTGMGTDGVRGMSAIKKADGYTVVQDPETAVVDSMPRAVIDAGVADVIVPPEKLVTTITELCS